MRRTLLLGAAVAGAAALRRRGPAVPVLPLTAGHRGGAGEPLLLLHGVGGTWRAWAPLLPHLEPHHDVLVPTLLGHGGADRLAPGVAPTLDALVDGAEAELDRAGLDTAHVVGNSLGGWIALELARRGRVRSVVLFSPGGAWADQWRIEMVAAAIRISVTGLARFAGHADAIASRRWLRQVLLATQVAHPDRLPPEELAATIRASADAPVVGPLLRMLPQLHLEPLPADRPYPVRIVWAEPDRVIPFAHFGAPMMERVPGAELVRRSGIGHVPMSDDPAGIARLILDVTTASGRPLADPLSRHLRPAACDGSDTDRHDRH